MTTAESTPLTCDPCYGTLTIDNVLLHGPAWCIPDLSELWGDPVPRTTRGVTIPHREGRKTYAPVNDETFYSFPFLLTGYCDQNGDPYPNFDVGLETNRAYLATYVTLPTNIGDGTRECVWTLPSGNTITTDVTVLGLRGRLRPGALFRGTLDLKCSTGALHLGG